jgi:hypothetical protein
MKKLPYVVLLLALAALPALAQVQYGTVSGTVVDNQQQALPGVSVTLAGPAMQGTRTLVTDADGRYRFSPVPPGAGYTVKFELSGFNMLDRGNLTVNLARDTRVDAEMAPSQFTETITVAADQIIVDTTKSTVDTNVDWELMDSIPNARWYQDIMELAPGVKPGNNPYVSGGSNTGNVYMIDGVDTTDPRTQTWGTALNYDAIAEVQLQTAAFQAEYGRATGGVLNLVTKSGGNQFSGTLRYVKQDADWSSERGTEKETGKKKTGGGVTDEARPIVALGGPILKDRLWFFGSYEERDNSRGFDYYATEADKVAGDLTQGRTSYTGEYISGKLTWQLNPNHNIVGFYNEDPIELRPLRAGWYGQSYNPTMELYQFQGGNNWSLQWTGVLTPSFFMEAKYQAHAQELNVSPDTPYYNQIPHLYSYNTAYYSGGPLDEYLSARDRDGLLLTGSYFLDLANSSHQFKAGIEYLGLDPKSGTTRNSMGYYRVRGTESGFDKPYIYESWTNQAGATAKPQDYYGIYVQDQWRIGDLTLNLGLRAEMTEIFNNKDKSIYKVSLGDTIAPRLGFAWDLNGDVLRGSIGRFYNLASNYISDYFQETPGQNVYSRFSWNNSCAVDGRDVWTYDPSCWSLATSYEIGSSAELDPNLEPGYVDEISLGFEKRISNQWAGSINFIWREQPTDIDWYDPTWSGYYLITNVPEKAIEDYPDAGLPNKISEYQAATIEVRKRLGPEGIQAFASYTYAFKDKAWGTDWRNVSAWIFWAPERVDKLWYGDNGDRQFFKVGGSYTMPWKTTVGINGWWQSGAAYTPYTYQGATVTSIPLAERGSYDVGSSWESDLYIEQAVRLGPVNLAGYVTFFNVFNNQYPTTRGANADVPASFMLPTAWQSPRSYQFGVKLEF